MKVHTIPIMSLKNGIVRVVENSSQLKHEHKFLRLSNTKKFNHNKFLIVITMPKQAPLPKPWEFLTGDVNWNDYNGMWIRDIDHDTYQVIELINLHDAMDSNYKFKYLVELHEVTLSEVDNSTLESALDTYGWQNDDTLTDYMKVEVLVIYGGFTTENLEGNNYTKLFAEILTYT